MPTFWSDTSQFQGAPVDDRYPHEIFSFRTNTGSVKDTLAVENARRAKGMGKLKIIMPYYFFRPGAANCDLAVDLLKEAGLWGDSRVVIMVDVESGNGSAQGPIPVRDHSLEINDEIARLRNLLGHKRVVGYLNGVADSHLWRNVPGDLPMITPSYSGIPGKWAATPPPQWLQDRAFGHQFTDSAITAPWPKGTDLNWSAKDISEIQVLLGVTEGKWMGVVEDGATQLSGRFGNVRRPVNPKAVDWLPKSFNPKTDPNGPAANDIWAATWNEVGWDGYTVPDQQEVEELLANNDPRSLVALVRTLLAQNIVMNNKLDSLLTEKDSK